MLERLTDAHLSRRSPSRARAWLRDHLEHPTQDLPRDDEELVAYVTQVVMQAEREPASAEAMELSFLELERARLDDEIAAAEANGGPPAGRAPAQRRAELTERIARAQS